MRSAANIAERLAFRGVVRLPAVMSALWNLPLRSE
jgi:hypothetical protein